MKYNFVYIFPLISIQPASSHTPYVLYMSPHIFNGMSCHIAKYFVLVSIDLVTTIHTHMYIHICKNQDYAYVQVHSLMKKCTISKGQKWGASKGDIAFYINTNWRPLSKIDKKIERPFKLKWFILQIIVLKWRALENESQWVVYPNESRHQSKE